MLTISDILEEVSSHFRRTGEIPSAVMIPDQDYYKLKNERITFEDCDIRLINCGRVVNEECNKQRTFKRS